MKKMISIFIVFILALSITACAEKNTESNSSTAEESKYPKITEKAVGVFDMENKKSEIE